MADIVNTMNNMGDRELVRHLSSTRTRDLIRLYRQHSKMMHYRIKNYIRVLDEKRFIDMYDLDLYAYPRVFTEEECIEYYTEEGLINKNNMPYLVDMVEILHMPNLLQYNITQYDNYPDGIDLFGNKYSNIKQMWLTGIEQHIRLKIEFQ